VIAGGTSTMPVQPLKLHGLIAPAFTPMRADRTLDLPTIDTLAKYFRDMGVSGVFVCGTSGEGPLLTADERRQVLERWCAAAKGVFPVIAHVGHAATAEARALATHAAEAGDHAVAPAAHGTARTIDLNVSRFGGLPAQKAMMTLAGVPCGPCRLPLRTLSPEQVEALREAFRTTPLGLTPPE
jgi:dihydrodipicolinate synthase/N-acetylneuraminate lyase